MNILFASIICLIFGFIAGALFFRKNEATILTDAEKIKNKYKEFADKF